MDIQTIGAWGELLGGISGLIAAVGVVLTLIYLAIQLRQNTEAVRTSMIQGVERGISELMASWTTSVEKAALVQKGFSSFNELSDDEKAFVRLSFRRLILHMDTLFWSYRQGLLPEEIWGREKSALRFCVKSPGEKRLGKSAVSASPFVDSLRPR